MEEHRERFEAVKAGYERSGARAAALGPDVGDAAAPDPPPLLKIDLGCGQTKPDATWTGVDFVPAPGVDVVCDLLTALAVGRWVDGVAQPTPWPFEDASADEIRCSHFFEHVPAHLRPRFMEELWRILKPGAGALLTTPYAWSARSIQDFTHEWPPICAESYIYFNESWREANKLTHGHYDIDCNFDVHFPGQVLDPMWAARHPDALAFASKHYVNVIADLSCLLVKRERLTQEERAEIARVQAQAQLAQVQAPKAPGQL